MSLVPHLTQVQLGPGLVLKGQVTDEVSIWTGKHALGSVLHINFPSLGLRMASAISPIFMKIIASMVINWNLNILNKVKTIIEYLLAQNGSFSTSSSNKQTQMGFISSPEKHRFVL